MKTTPHRRSERPLVTRLTRASTIALLALAPPALSQVVVHPNQIVGELRFTNVNPEIRAELDRDDGPDAWSWNVQAARLGDGPPLEAETRATSSSRTLGRYELTVESSEEGIAYEVDARLALGTSRDGYRFAPVVSAPVHVEPAPDVTVDFAECVTLLRLRFAAADGAPSPVRGGHVTAWMEPGGVGEQQSVRYLPRGVSEILVPVRATGEQGSVRVRWTVGDDPRHDTITYERWFEPIFACDEIVDLECRGRGDGEDGLGRIVGLFDVVGHHEEPMGLGTAWQLTRPEAMSGPYENRRDDAIPGDPSSGAFELENLMPSAVTDPPTPYTVRVRHAFGIGRAFTYAVSPGILVEVPAGETVDLGDTLVMTPAVVAVDVRLATGPTAPTGLQPLTSLLHVDDDEVDPDGDGVPNSPSAAHQRSGARGYPIWTGGEIYTGLATTWSDEESALALDYALVLSSPGDVVRSWSASRLDLVFDHAAPADPEEHLDAWLSLWDGRLYDVELAPGERLEHERSACLGTLTVDVRATDGTFHSPELRSTSFEQPERDFLGRAPTEIATAIARGTPLDDATAAAEGRVVMPLLEGRYVLQPTVQAIGPGGATSTTEVLPVTVKVGCRQDVRARPEVSLSLGDMPPCADAGRVPVRAEVLAEEPIAFASIATNDGTPVEICAPCGRDPVLETWVDLGDGAHAVTLRVVDAAGRDAEATAHALFAREPSDLGRAGAPPLRLERAGGGVVLSWEDVPDATAAVSRGTLASLRADRTYDHATVGPCDIDGGRLELDAEGAPAGAYFLVAGRCAWGETAPGRDSFGRPRPLALERCP